MQQSASIPTDLLNHIANLDNPKPAEVFDLLDRHAKKIEAPEPIMVKRKCACNHVKDVSEFRIVDTGVVRGVLDNVCVGCRKECDDTVAHLCCISCKEVFGHFYPGKDPSGFCTTIGRYYHTQECPQCSSKAFSPILEQILFYKLNGIPYNEPASAKQNEKD
jgi:hypothetical protein